jgi:CRISPR/Cas system-associated exonuclease Cas4 (RecB family)
MKELGLNRITPSMIAQYDSCPLNFYYSSWLGLKLPQSQMHLKFGTAIHNAIAELWTKRNLQLGLDMFSAEFILDSLAPEDFKTEADRLQKYGEMLHDGKLILTEFFSQLDKFEKIDNILPESFELPWKEILTNPETNLDPLEVPLSCRVDLLGKNHHIVDFKTSSAEYDIFEARAMPQMLSYAWIYLQKYKVIPTIHIIVLIKKRKKNKIQHLEIVYRMADLLAFNSKVRSILEGIRNHEFKRPLKDHPYFCDCRKYEEILKY